VDVGPGAGIHGGKIVAHGSSAAYFYGYQTKLRRPLDYLRAKRDRIPEERRAVKKDHNTSRSKRDRQQSQELGT